MTNHDYRTQQLFNHEKGKLLENKQTKNEYLSFIVHNKKRTFGTRGSISIARSIPSLKLSYLFMDFIDETAVFL